MQVMTVLFCALSLTAYSQDASHHITLDARQGGSLSVTSTSINDGDTALLTVLPNKGYRLSSISGCGGQLSSGFYRTAAIKADCTVTASFAAATGRAWIWEGGSTRTYVGGVYGRLGLAAAANMPGARSGAAQWMDAQGNLWMFGGNGVDAQDTPGSLNDLWEFQPKTGLWTWVGGSNRLEAPSVYGVLARPATQNMPGARSHPIFWTDASGNFWLFGGWHNNASKGNSEEALSDLWKYQVKTGLWTWEGGSKEAGVASVVGVLGQASAHSMPGSRSEATGWTDALGNLWLFGGLRLVATDHGRWKSYTLNDLWKFQPATGLWTWEGGAHQFNESGIYGVLGKASPANVPGARDKALGWTDRSGNLWLFGGLKYDAQGNMSSLNDLWMYQPATRQWTWEGGSKSTGVAHAGVYGVRGKPDVANMPGARYGASGWTDAGGNLWLLAGGSISSSGNNIDYNDLWKFDPSTREWTWEEGAATAYADSVYGRPGQEAADNQLGAREDMLSWQDKDGKVWMFGGIERAPIVGHDSDRWFNDLWLFLPSTSSPLPSMSKCPSSSVSPESKPDTSILNALDKSLLRHFLRDQCSFSAQFSALKDPDFANAANFTCRTVPDEPDETLFVFVQAAKDGSQASPQAADNNAEDDGEASLSLVILLSKENKILAKYVGENSINSDALVFDNLDIDTGRYILSPGVRAFGVRAGFSGRGGAGCLSQEALSLFVYDGKSIHAVLSGLNVRSGGSAGSETLNLRMAPTKHHGYADIIVTGSVERDTSAEGGDGRCADSFQPEKIKKHLLEFNGRYYKVPNSLCADELTCW